ncbi:MAG: AAA family ATPase, partial [bacterium]
VFHWALNVPELERIKSLSKMVESHNFEAKALTEKSERYLNLLERFLEDSGKKVEFSDKGYVLVTLTKDRKRIPVASFSSGEAQIFVILTHLFFNPRAERNNVFIIDEPELSLHVQWQELFVKSVIEANPNVQYIMATHSPSIILDKIDKCQDIISEIHRV